MNTPELSILIPVRDEAVNIPIMVKFLCAQVAAPFEILILCDDPADNSIAATRALEADHPVRLLLHPGGRGVARAVEAGIAAARAEVLLISVIDDIGAALVVNDMFALIGEGCDVVSCTRYAHGGKRVGGSLIGKTLSGLANRAFGLFSGAALSDLTTGIKMFRRRAIQSIALRTDTTNWSFAFDLAVDFELGGSTLGEVPMVSVDRAFGGKSTCRILI
ncbi:MAG: glycosyltransferase, partial [Planctomycetes bacterium]|nr:glycosyltransferase [Planctomycetota bacterium]